MNVRLRPLAVTLAAACQLSSFAVAAAELLANPGFEAGVSTVAPCSGAGVSAPVISGQLGNSWESNNCWMNAPASTVTFAQEAGRSGGLSQVITTNSASGDAVIATWVWLVPGQRYTTSIWLKADTPTEVILQLRAWGAPYTAYGNAVAKVGTTWTQFQFEGVAPAATGQVPGGLFIIPKGAAKLWLDDASVTSAADATTGTAARRGATVPASYFGIHVHRDPKWPAIGKAIGSERFWDTEGVEWADVYPNDPAAGGAANWTAFDNRLNRAIANGADVVVTLGGLIPGWATSDPTGAAPGCSMYYDNTTGKGLGSSAPPKSDQVWQDWVRAVATHAKGKVKYWEIWNEPYQCSLFQSNLPRLAKMVADARTILKQVDPANVVLSPAFDLSDTAFIDRYLQAARAAYPAGEAYGDITAVHAYDNFIGNYLDGRVAKDPQLARSVESMLEQEHLVLNARMVLKRFGLDTRPIWNTEGGYLKAASATGTPDDAAGVPFVARHYLLSWAAGLDRNYYYAWDQRGLVVAGGREKTEGDLNFITTAAGTAYQQVAKWLAGAELYDRTVDAGTGNWILTLKRGLTLSYVVWNPSAAASYTVPAGRTVMSSLSGGQTTVGASASVSASPVMFAAPANTITLSTSSASIKVNKSVTFTAKVSGGSAPSGTVQFKANGVNIGSPVALSAGSASLATSQFSKAGTYAITAVYSGDTVNLSNTSAALTETVSPLTCFGLICW